MDIEFVGIDLTLHDILAEPPRSGDENHVAEAGFGVERKDDAAGRKIGADHFHDPDRQRDLEVVEAVVDPINDGAVGKDRGKTAPARLDCIGLAAHVQKALMLPGETGGRQILGGRRAAHRDRDFGTASLLEPAVGVRDLCTECRIAGGVVNETASDGSALGKQRHIMMVEAREQPAKFHLDPSLGQRCAIGPRGQCETFGYSVAEQRAQFAKRCGLAADRRHILQSDILEPADMVFGSHERSPAACVVADNAATG